MSATPVEHDQKSRLPRRVGLVAGFLALAALPALGLGAYAAADTTSGTSGESGPAGPGFGRVVRAPLSDEQKQCLTDHGVTLPQRPANPDAGTRPAPPTDEQRAAFHAAAEACGLPTPPAGGRGFRPQLTDTQKQCLADQGVTLPTPPTPGSGERPQPPTAEQRAAFHAAAEACNLPVPAHGPPPGTDGNGPRETAV